MKRSPTFEYTMPMFIFYKNHRMVTNDFLEACKSSDTLTLDLGFLKDMREVPRLDLSDHGFRTPFKEIQVVSPVPEFSEEWEWMLLPQQDYTFTYSQFIKRLASIMEETLLRWWDPNRIHLMHHSSGHDSRIVSAVLSRLKRSQGKDWLGEVKFICYPPEHENFRRIMQHLGFGKHQYLVYCNVDRYVNDTLTTFSEVAGFESFITAETDPFRTASPDTPFDEIDYFDANIHNYLLAYPIPKRAAKRVYCSNVKVNGFIDTYYGTYATRWPTVYLHRFHDYLVLGNQYEYVDLATRLPNKYKGPILFRRPQDRVRRDLCEYLSPGIMRIPMTPFGVCRDGSERDQQNLRRLYESSQFYRDFSYPMVRNAQPWLVDAAHNHGFDQCLLSLAAHYELLRNFGKNICAA